MSKCEELRNFISQLFEAATDKSIIEKTAVVSSKIDEIEAEQRASSEDYNKLLKDYKDVVIHSSFKPANSADRGADSPITTFNANDAFEAALKSVMDNKNN